MDEQYQRKLRDFIMLMKCQCRMRGFIHVVHLISLVVLPAQGFMYMYNVSILSF